MNRLRAIFGDPLLLPARRGMVATQRALDLQGPLNSALEGLRQVFAEGAPFEASTATATVTISASDYVQHALLTPFVLASACSRPDPASWLRTTVAPGAVRPVRASRGAVTAT